MLSLLHYSFFFFLGHPESLKNFDIDIALCSCRFYIICYKNLQHLWLTTLNTKRTMGHRLSKFLIRGLLNLAQLILRSLACLT
uniref:DCUP n=1 Tax=Arundo donax TaxID=35708 RepID=A0A0A9HNN1_ARUDO